MSSQYVTMQLPQATGGTINLVYDEGYWRLADATSNGQAARLERELYQLQTEGKALRQQFSYLREAAIGLTQTNYNLLRSSCARSYQ